MEVAREFTEDAIDRARWHGSDDEFLELLTRIVFRTGFSGAVVERRWAAFQSAFVGFCVDQVAKFDALRVEDLLRVDSAIVKNARKVRATIDNAQVCLRLREEWGSLAGYLDQVSLLGETAGRSRFKRDFHMVGESAAKSLWIATFEDERAESRS